jgi:5-formyltetrahydrofolate cyclo-ligase
MTIGEPARFPDMSDFDHKAPFRALTRSLRAALKPAHPDAAVQAAARFAAAGLGPFASAAVYHPRGTELDPFPLAGALARQGVRVLLPVVVDKDQPLVFRVMGDGPLPKDALGIPSPPPEAEAVRPDLVVTPLLAFDRRGGRLGQGGGYYDRTLAALRAQGPVFVLGLGYAGQELDALPMGPHDQRLDGVLTERGYRTALKD